jgi:two-component system cell cycle sensor histidine kinase/response regulator CckA
MANTGQLHQLAAENHELRRRMHELELSVEVSAAAIRASGLGLWSWDVLGGELVWDDGMRRLHACASTPTVESYLNEVVHPADRAEAMTRAQRMLDGGPWDRMPYRIVQPNGVVRWVLASGAVVATADGKPQRLVGGLLDITEQRALEEQLRQAQKMEAIGNLTAGIAHNFNNMLCVIMPTLDFAIGWLPNERKPMLREAAHAARRASELVRQLMTFAGQSQSAQRAHHSCHDVVKAAVDICARVFGEDLQLTAAYEDEAVPLHCNAGQIEQVLVNLLLNARDAVLAAGPPRGHVSVRVSTRRAQGDRLSHEPERWVRIDVSDDGIGMSEEVRSKAFEPFFTTKGVGRGTGLGLATSYAIVREHKGRLDCASHAGLGTTFTLMLPATRLPSASKARQPLTADSSEAS